VILGQGRGKFAPRILTPELIKISYDPLFHESRGEIVEIQGNEWQTVDLMFGRKRCLGKFVPAGVNLSIPYIGYVGGSDSAMCSCSNDM